MGILVWTVWFDFILSLPFLHRSIPIFMFLQAAGPTGEAPKHRKTQHWLRQREAVHVEILSLFKVVFNGITNYGETTKTDVAAPPSLCANTTVPQFGTETLTAPENSVGCPTFW
jgi:hypothetical protein